MFFVTIFFMLLVQYEDIGVYVLKKTLIPYAHFRSQVKGNIIPQDEAHYDNFCNFISIIVRY